MNYRMIKHILGWIMLFEAIFLAVPMLAAVIFGEKAVWSFLITAGICVACGLLLTRLAQPKSRVVYAREGVLIVSLAWISISLFGALPFFISGTISSYVDALFETVSGFTTTGASILPQVETVPKSMLLWRSFTHWVGGMGVLVFIMAFLPLSGAQNLHIMRAESPGPSVGKLVPRVRTTAMILYIIYFALTLTQFLILLCGGMPVFDALNISFATAGTGGFGVRNNSMAGYTPFLQTVTGIFMLLFSLNFSCYYLLYKGKFKDAFNAETRAFLCIVAAAVTVIAFNTRGTASLLDCFFSVSSVISTTGFATADFNLWPPLSKAVLVLLMFIGACAGSTGGGIKVSRILILGKSAARELRRIIHPNRVQALTLDRRPVENSVEKTVSAYFVCYLILFTASVLVLTAGEHDLVTCFTAVAATINNIGPGLELVGPNGNFAFFSVTSKLTLIFDMLAGRLELFPMLLLFSPTTWKK